MTEDPFSTGEAAGLEVPDAEARPAADVPDERWWQLVVDRAFVNPKVRASAVMLLALVLATGAVPIWAPVLVGAGPTDQDLVLGPQPPLTRGEAHGELGAASGRRVFHGFGTDELGRDLLVRVGYGGRVALSIGIFGALVALAVGLAMGAACAFLPGRAGRGARALLRGLSALPLLLFALVPIWLANLDLAGLCLALGGVLWLRIARELCVRLREVRRRASLDLARVAGASEWAILRGHVLPAVAPTVLVSWVFTVPTVMVAEALLSFVGLGVGPPHSSWGTLAAEGAATMDLFPWLMLFPGLALALTVIALRWLGEGMRAALGGTSAGEVP